MDKAESGEVSNVIVKDVNFQDSSNMENSVSLIGESVSLPTEKSVYSLQSGIGFEDPENDLLMQHIRLNKLPYFKRRPTVSDGNCWYDAVADQIVLHNIPNKPRDHVRLRSAICRFIPSLSQTTVWIENIFGNDRTKFNSFIAQHQRDCEWTDDYGIMCQATALYLERNIHVVGTVNIGQSSSFTKIEATSESDRYPPLTVGFYQG